MDDAEFANAGSTLMRISDLSRRSGVPVATIKFYLRERLLPPGEPTGRNQAVYGARHLRRLHLIKMFTTIGQLDLTSVRQLLTAIEDEQVPIEEIHEVLNRVLGAPEDSALSKGQHAEQARADADRIVEAAGWQVRKDAAARTHLALVLSAMRRLGCHCGPDFFDDYVKAADGLARKEIDLLSRDETARAELIARSVLLEEAFTAIRHLAQAHHLALWLKSAPARPPDS